MRFSRSLARLALTSSSSVLVNLALSLSALETQPASCQCCCTHAHTLARPRRLAPAPHPAQHRLTITNQLARHTISAGRPRTPARKLPRQLLLPASTPDQTGVRQEEEAGCFGRLERDRRTGGYRCWDRSWSDGRDRSDYFGGGRSWNDERGGRRGRNYDDGRAGDDDPTAADYAAG